MSLFEVWYWGYAYCVMDHPTVDFLLKFAMTCGMYLKTVKRSLT